MNRKERAQKKWEAVKPKGIKFYLLSRGIFFYGLIYFVAFVIIGPFINAGYSFIFMNEDTFLVRLVIMIPICILGGMLIAYSYWKSSEKRFGK